MTYNSGAMRIESPFVFAVVHKMVLSAEINEHIRLELWGLLDPDAAPALMREQYANASVKITLPDGQDYFTGLLLQIDIQEKNGLFPIYLSCVSASWLLDVHPRSRSFQDIQETYHSILQREYADEEHASVATSKLADVPITTPIFQYGETAWAFTLRMAGKLGACVIPDHREAFPRVTVGDIARKPVELDKPDYTTGQNRENGYSHSLRSAQQLALGDTVTHMGRNLLVVEKYSTFENGSFDNSYVLGTESGFAVTPHNFPLSGLRLRGTVLATSGELLKLHLDIDEKQDVAKAYWFDFVPQSGNVMYCMPQVGTKSLLRFCSNLDSSAVAEECWRENGQEYSGLENYPKRYFTTEFKKCLAMLPQHLFFVGDSSLLTLSDHNGIMLKTSRSTEITAGGSITVHAKKRATVDTPQHIYMTKPGTTSIIDFAGTEINVESKNTGVKTRRNSEKDKPYPASQAFPSATVSRSLAKAALGFVPKISGKGVR